VVLLIAIEYCVERERGIAQRVVVNDERGDPDANTIDGTTSPSVGLLYHVAVSGIPGEAARVSWVRPPITQTSGVTTG